MSFKKRILFFPGLDGTGLLLNKLKDRLPEYDCHILSYPETASTISDIVSHIDSSYQLDTYSYFFAESFGTQILPLLLNANELTQSTAIFLAPFIRIPVRFQIMLKLPGFLLEKNYARVVSTPLLSYFCLGNSSDSVLKEEIYCVVKDLDPAIVLRRLLSVNAMNGTDIKLPNSVIISTAKDRLIPERLQLEFARSIGCEDRRIIKAPHFAALTHTEQIAEIIASL